ncbi:hypothetical protein JKG47_01100 [Acidithiobacillus sp. MC6.1]|nr:hypothetical protein [Acidithiobacillus sp. MC6.1]
MGWAGAEVKASIAIVVENILLDASVGQKTRKARLPGKHPFSRERVTNSPEWGRLPSMPGALQWVNALSAHYKLHFVTTAPWLLREAVCKNLAPFGITGGQVMGLGSGVAMAVRLSGAKGWIDSNADRVTQAREAGVTWPIWVCHDHLSVEEDLFGMSVIDHPDDALVILGGKIACGY